MVSSMLPKKVLQKYKIWKSAKGRQKDKILNY